MTHIKGEGERKDVEIRHHLNLNHSQTKSALTPPFAGGGRVIGQSCTPISRKMAPHIPRMGLLLDIWESKNVR